jgi:hypothetical protein
VAVKAVGELTRVAGLSPALALVVIQVLVGKDTAQMVHAMVLAVLVVAQELTTHLLTVA